MPFQLLYQKEKKKENCKCSKLCLQCLLSPVSFEAGYVTCHCLKWMLGSS